MAVSSKIIRAILYFVSAVILLLVLYTWTHYSPAGPHVSPDSLDAITLDYRLRNSAEHDAARTRNGGNPYILRLSADSGGELLYYGASHSQDPDHPQLAEIDSLWTDFRPTVALYEGTNGYPYGVLIEPFAGLPEPAMVHKLARKNDTPIFTLEPPFSHEVAEHQKDFRDDQITLYFFLRVFSSESLDKRDDKNALRILGKRSAALGLDTGITFIQQLDSMWLADYPMQDDWRDLTYEPDLGYLKEISHNSRRIRGEHMARLLIDFVRKGERVFAVVGSGHVIRQEWNLRSAFNAEPAWDQPVRHSSELRVLTSMDSMAVFTTNDGLPDNEVRSIHQDPKGNMWFSGKGIASFDGRLWTYYTHGSSFPMQGASDIISIDNETLLATGPGGFATLRGDAWQFTTTMDAIEPRVVFSASSDSRGTIWFGANGGCAWQESETWESITQDDGLPHRVVHACVRDSAETIWIATRRGLAKYADNSISILFPDDNFGSILIDSTDRLWFGTRSSGVRVFDGTIWTQYEDGADVRPAIQASDGSIWAVSDNRGAYRFKDGIVTTYGIDDLPSNTVFDIIQTDDNAIWFATDKGVARYVEQ